MRFRSTGCLGFEPRFKVSKTFGLGRCPNSQLSSFLRSFLLDVSASRSERPLAAERAKSHRDGPVTGGSTVQRFTAAAATQPGSLTSHACQPEPASASENCPPPPCDLGPAKP
eukprot:3779644-Rhodomonas_salina.1